MPLTTRAMWPELVRKTVVKHAKRFEPKPCHFQMMAMMRCLSQHNQRSEMCTVAARAYQTCMRQKGRIGGHTKSAPQQTKYSIRKNKLRKRGHHHPD